MTRWRLILAAAVWIFSSGSGSARAGGMTSSGGEWITVEENPWFIGPKPVSYCLETGPGFSQALPAAQKVVRAVLSDWAEALQRLHPRPTLQALPDGEAKGLTLRFTEEPCRDSTELTFRLGSFGAEVEDALRHHARYTLALALQTGLDEATGRVHKGIVWLAPDSGERAYAGPHRDRMLWASDATLFNVLLHEVGHVVGFPHTETGFMRSTYPADIARRPPSARDSAAALVRESWWTLSSGVCGIAETSGSVAGTSVQSGDRVCLKPLEQGPERFRIELLLPVAAQANDQGQQQQPSAQGQPIGWPTAEGAVIEPDRIRGDYYSLGKDGPVYWEHTFVSVPAHLRVRGYAQVGAGLIPVLLEQQGPAIDLIFPALGEFQVLRVSRLEAWR